MHHASCDANVHALRASSTGYRALSGIPSVRYANVCSVSSDDYSPADKRAEIGRLRAEGKSYSEIAAALGLCKATIAYHSRRLNLPVDEKASRRYDWTEIQAAHDRGLSVRQCMATFGFSQASWHAAVNRGALTPRPACKPLAEVLVEGRPTHRSHLRVRLVKEGLKADRCERCGLSEWQGRYLSPQLHHRNGRKHDNRLENLELLCPNCHAQTENWGGRNKKGLRKAA